MGASHTTSNNLYSSNFLVYVPNLKEIGPRFQAGWAFKKVDRQIVKQTYIHHVLGFSPSVKMFNHSTNDWIWKAITQNSFIYNRTDKTYVRQYFRSRLLLWIVRPDAKCPQCEYFRILVYAHSPVRIWSIAQTAQCKINSEGSRSRLSSRDQQRLCVSRQGGSTALVGRQGPPRGADNDVTLRAAPRGKPARGPLRATRAHLASWCAQRGARHSPRTRMTAQLASDKTPSPGPACWELVWRTSSDGGAACSAGFFRKRCFTERCGRTWTRSSWLGLFDVIMPFRHRPQGCKSSR